MNLVDLKSHLAAMCRIRAFEEKLTEIRKRGTDIFGSIHLYVGQESVAVGALAALKPDDPVFATYRGHGWALACGVPPELIFAEIMGRETGVCKGRGGSAMFSAVQWRFYGENSIVGAGAPMAVGAAMSASFRGTGQVAVAAFGDGAMNQGAVHEAMNFAACKRYGVIFICENNNYSEMTPIAEMVGDENLYKRAAAYGMPGERIDGNDISQVKAAVLHFSEAARAGKGPALIEVMTQRLVGHYWGDMQSYRPKGELRQLAEVEPIARLRRELHEQGVSTEELDSIQASAALEIAEAAERAHQAPLAEASDARSHMYA